MELNNEEREQLYKLKNKEIDFVDFNFADTSLRITRKSLLQMLNGGNE